MDIIQPGSEKPKLLWLSTSSMGLEPIADSLRYCMKKMAFLGLKLSMGNETVTKSFKLPDWDMAIFHYDHGKEAQHHYEGEVDHEIFKIVNHYQPDCVVYAGPAEGKCRPQTDTFLWIKDKGIKTIAFICDGGCPGWHPAIREYALKNAFDLMVNGDANPNWPKREQDMTTHGLVCPEYFNPKPWSEREIKFGAIIGLGSPRRQKETAWLSENVGLVLGPRSEKWGDYQSYADYMCNTKATVNFPEGGGDGNMYQLKYRVMESGYAGCALFERRNPITRMYLDPEHDYFEYDDVEDVHKRLAFTADEELFRRAKNLQKKVTVHFNPEPVWKKMLEGVGFTVLPHP